MDKTLTARDQIRNYITRELLMKPDLALADSEELLLSGLIDSLGAMRLIAHLETLYGIKVPPEDVLIEHFETIDAMAQYLAQRGVN